MTKPEYLELLKAEIERQHQCRAEHGYSVPVHEMFRGRTVWKGVVEVFKITGHPKAARCFGWLYVKTGEAGAHTGVTILERPEIDSALLAVRAQVARDAKARPTG